ncbi:movement protein binding protein 2C [Artemisia annua]|uniref:Movement protein binding protein 2C n=1 Tax=Artemisia annua TaxID=35608 RepID=A0A2U1KJD9_ARTAN|nr:movement protein binding protein 2C [Artemisia annua]
MYQQQQQHFDLEQENVGFGGGEASSWLSGGEDLRPSTGNGNGNDQKANSSYTRRGSMIKTKTPSITKMTEGKSRNAQSIPGKKRRENGGNEQEGGGDGLSLFSNAVMTKEKEELAELREKVEDLQRQLLEKDETLKSAEASKHEISSIHSVLNQVKQQASEKEALLRSTQAQLADVKVSD